MKVKKGEIYLVDLKDTYCNVQNGTRPCLIIQNNYGNDYSPTTIVVPITSKIKKTNMPVHVVVEKGISPHKSYEMILCESIITISKDQIKNYLRTVDDSVIKKVDEALEVSLGIKGLNRREEH